MSAYKISLITADLLALIIAAIWIIYKLTSMTFADIYVNASVYALLIYVAIGNLYLMFNKEGE